MARKKLERVSDNPYKNLSHAERCKALADYLTMKRIELSFRRNYSVSQSELAADMDLSQATYSMYESGKRLPQSDNLHKVAGYFGDRKVYQIVGEPERLPDNEMVVRFADAVAGGAPIDTLKRLVAEAEDAAEMQRQRYPQMGGLNDNGT